MLKNERQAYQNKLFTWANVFTVEILFYNTNDKIVDIWGTNKICKNKNIFVLLQTSRGWRVDLHKIKKIKLKTFKPLMRLIKDRSYKKDLSTTKVFMENLCEATLSLKNEWNYN